VARQSPRGLGVTMNAATAGRRKALVGRLIWLAALAGIVAIGLIWLPREYPEMGFWQSLYATARLFVFEYDLPRFPTAWPLIAIHFVAPIVAVSAAWTIINRLFHLSPSLRIRWMRDHVVVCGVGRTGRLLAQNLKEDGVAVVGVDLAAVDLLDEWHSEWRVPVVQGSFHSRLILEKARVARARAIVFASGDDLANLEGAVGAYAWLSEVAGRKRSIWTHVANEKLAATAKSVVKHEGRVSLRFFDTYRIAARSVVARHFDGARRVGVERITIIGFGKFGRDLFEIMISDLAADEDIRIGVIDICDREKAVMQLARELGFAERVDFRRADIHDLDFNGEPGTAFFLCTDDDMGNLTGAFELAAKTDAKIHSSHVYVRMAKWPLSAIAGQLGDEHGVTFININELVAEGIRDMPGLFAPEHR
jgi:hypothetical protein